MATKIYLITSVMFFFLAQDLVKAGEATPEYYWRDGQDKVILKLVPSHIIEFSGDEIKSGARRNFQVVNEKKLMGGVRLLRLSKSDFTKLVKEKGVNNQTIKNSPLFKQGSDYKALPGGVVVTFKSGLTDAEIQSFCQSQGLILKRKYSLKNQLSSIWLVDSPPGLASLDLANSILENHSEIVEKSRPNFWQALETRELKELNEPEYFKGKPQVGKLKRFKNSDIGGDHRDRHDRNKQQP